MMPFVATPTRARILVFSDVPKWLGYKELVLRYRPDLVLLAGDVTSDGFATFWSEALERIPAFRRKKQELACEYDIEIHRDNFFKISDRDKWNQFSNRLDDSREEYRNSQEFHAARRALHVEPFYSFLRFAGRRATVFVVKGDHDDDFPGDYDVDRINSLRGCAEISGKAIEAHGLRLLGLGFNETHYKRVLRDLVARFAGAVDILVAHSEQPRVPILAEFRPRLIARGHFGYGRFLVKGIPSIFTGGRFYSIARVGRSMSITQYKRGFGEGSASRPRKFDGANCRPWFSEASEFEKYPWLKPYHQVPGTSGEPSW